MDKTTDRYVHALSSNWRTEVIDRQVEQYNEQRRQEAFERQRIRIQTELKLQGYQKKPGKKVEKTDEIKRLCEEYPYNARVHYKLKNGRIVVRRIVSVWHEDDRGKPVCNARTKDGKKTVLSADRIIRRKTRKEIDNV